MNKLIILKTIKDYIELQLSFFPKEQQTLYYFRCFSSPGILKQHGFSLVFSVGNRVSNYRHNGDDEIEIVTDLWKTLKNLASFRSCILYINKNKIPVWSNSFNRFLLVLEKSNIVFHLRDFSGSYVTSKIKAVSEQTQISKFYGYSYEFDVKNADHILKNAFSFECNDENMTLVSYLEKKYTKFVYGDLSLPFFDTKNLFFKFWCKDLFLVGCDFGIVFNYNKVNRIYFVLACADDVKTKSALANFSPKYNIEFLQYQSPTIFIEQKNAR